MPNGQAKGRIVPVRFTPADLAEITRAAKASKQSLSEWVRGTLIAKARDGK
jgi:hypothetical protein